MYVVDNMSEFLLVCFNINVIFYKNKNVIYRVSINHIKVYYSQNIHTSMFINYVII